MTRDRKPGYKEKFWAEHDIDAYECPDCGNKRSEVNQFDVHHIDGNPKNNQMDNLVALCQSCHYDRHGIDPSRADGHWSDEYYYEWQSNETPLKYL